MFKEAARRKVRFETRIGFLTVEDLWDLPLIHESKVNLDEIAIALNKKLRECNSESFVKYFSPKADDLQLKFNVVKDIIDTKLQEAQENEKKQARESRRQELLGLKARKRQEIDMGKTLEEIDKELAELD